MTTYRGRIFTPVGNPFAGTSPDNAYRYYEDGFLSVEKGIITAIGGASDEPRDSIVQLEPSQLIVPGFVDTHIHGPQLEMIGSFGGDLLDWLTRYTFPTEAAFADPSHARRVATALFDQLSRHGTVTAMIFSSIHAEATNAFFEAASARGTRAIIGKTMMDRNAPPELLEDAGRSYEESRELAQRWHGRGRLRYAVTPRFSPTSSDRLLHLAGRIVEEFEGVYVQTHISENLREVEWVRSLFPDASDYLDSYARHGLVHRRTVLAHGVHLTRGELGRIGSAGASVAHCPNSNLFLGSGLFALDQAHRAGVRVALGSDIGAGTTPSMFNAMADAYKVQRTRGRSLDPVQLWYLATLAGAEALDFANETGSLETGKSADFLILDLAAFPLMAQRTANASSLIDLLAGVIFLGDDRLVAQTVIAGETVWKRS